MISRRSYLTRVSTPDPVLQYVCSYFFLPPDSDKFIVTFILNPFDSPFPLRTPIPFSSRSRGEIHSDFASGPEIFRRSLRRIVSLSSLSSLDRNRAHRHPTRKGAPACNAETGSEVGSHVYGIEERPEMLGLYTKAMPKSNLPLRKPKCATNCSCLRKDSFFTCYVKWCTTDRYDC